MRVAKFSVFCTILTLRRRPVYSFRQKITAASMNARKMEEVQVRNTRKKERDGIIEEVLHTMQNMGIALLNSRRRR